MILEAFITSLLIELTPGPNMGWLALLSASRGRLIGLSAVAGIALGLSIAAVAAALGLSLLIATTPWLFQMLRIAGSLYLLYLAWEAWNDGAGEDGNGLDATASHYFIQGLISNSLNPKAYLVYAAILPQFMTADAKLPEIVLYSAIYVAVATGVHAGIALLAGGANRLFQDKTRARILSRIAALLLVAIAVWFFLTTSRTLG